MDYNVVHYFTVLYHRTTFFLFFLADALSGYTRTVKLKSRPLEFRVASIFEDYATGRLKLHTILTLLALKLPSSVVLKERVSALHRICNHYIK